MAKKTSFVITVILALVLFNGLRVVVLSLEQGTKVNPYQESEWIYDTEYEKIRPLFHETDIRSLIRIHDETDVNATRRRLIQFLWGNDGFPVSKLPTKIEKGIIDTRYLHPALKRQAKKAYWLNQAINLTPGIKLLMAPVVRYGGMSHLKEIDKITIEMEYGLNSILYHFIPTTSNNKLVIYHQGHNGDFIHGQETIRAFLAKGYAVLGASMPLLGMNNHPVIEVEHIGKLKMISHDHMKFLSPEEGHPVKYFLEPVATALNELEKYQYDDISMLGISGGAWTTTLYAAIDPRITQSYPVAGSLPLFLRANKDWGDYEASVPELYTQVNYLELYILGAFGEQRKQIQILNQYDPCCFSGKGYTLYEAVIQEKLKCLQQGTFAVYLDSSHHSHSISEQALTHIFQHLEHAE